EVGDLPREGQGKLLRLLEEHEYLRVGDTEPRRSDARVIAATHRDLRAASASGAFREDLFYRLNVVAIEMPPLRARPSDVSLLAMRFLQKYASENGKNIQGFSHEALSALSHYGWPGNVRELENAIERSVVICRGNEIGLSDLSPSITQQAGRSSDGMPQIPGAKLADLERFAILRTLEHTGGSTSRAADMLGISARTIQYRLQEYSGAQDKSASSKGASGDSKN
ncbi:MAG TPA: sigma 54-interacting transcriptional regulator, partial [Polyangiales bacterium]|nr:sigma 54-interacting transcriptional regulator [Polyangiales bacterium]